MKNHESVGRGEDFNQGDVSPESEAHEYEKSLNTVDADTIYSAEHNADRLLADLVWRIPDNNSPRERYNNEHRKNEIDRLRLFKETEVLHNYDFRRDREKIPESNFFRLLADTCEHSNSLPHKEIPPLSDSEKKHLIRSANNITQYLSGENNRESSFAHYLISLVKMCRGVYGENSRAEMYLCDDLNQLLKPDESRSSESKKSEIVDRLIDRKLNAAQKIATGEIHSSGRVLIGFTGALDLPDGIENRSLKELVEEGVPSLYGYSD